MAIVVAVLPFAALPGSPTRTRPLSLPIRYFTEREEKILVYKVMRDEPAKPDTARKRGNMYMVPCGLDSPFVYLETVTISSMTNKPKEPHAEITVLHPLSFRCRSLPLCVAERSSI